MDKSGAPLHARPPPPHPTQPPLTRRVAAQCDYLFLRNFYPDASKLQARLQRAPGTASCAQSVHSNGEGTSMLCSALLDPPPPGSAGEPACALTNATAL